MAPHSRQESSDADDQAGASDDHKAADQEASRYGSADRDRDGDDTCCDTDRTHGPLLELRARDGSSRVTCDTCVDPPPRLVATKLEECEPHLVSVLASERVRVQQQDQ